MRRGFILHMWTGTIENPRTGRPILFGSVARARRYVDLLPAWGRVFVEVWACRVRAKGANGLPDYIVEGRVFQ